MTRTAFPTEASSSARTAQRGMHLARALLIDGSPMLRSTMAAQLRDIGIAQITQTGRVADARLVLERDTFDIVLCSREFEGSDVSGQDLLDELRREQILPHSTVFIMVTSQATYHQVVEAAESALDGLLIRPYTAVKLAERITESRARKLELADLLRALDDGDHDGALRLAIGRFQSRAPYATWCGRVAAELLLRMRRAEDARLLFEKLAALAPASWAQLGIARAQLAVGDIGAARRTLNAVLVADPVCADARDLLGRLLVDQCDFDAALAEYRKAAEITPGCLLRQQHAGALAFYQDESAEALRRLETAISLGQKSKLFDALTLALVALLRFDRGDTTGVAAMRDQLQGWCERHPASRRLQRLHLLATTLYAHASGTAQAADEGLGAFGAQAQDDDFDLEAATLLLALARRMPERFTALGDSVAVVEALGSRFAVSKAIGEVLIAAVGRAEPWSGLLRARQAEVSQQAEEAMATAKGGQAEGAIHALLERGETLRNTRLLELARSMARRFAADLPDAEGFEQRAATLLARWAHAVNHIAGIQRSGRSPGAMQLRG